jgi:hypothetical protein
MVMQDLIAKSESLIQWLDRTLNGIEIKPDVRSKLAAGCLDTALEHQKAIVLLVAKHLYGSAYALIRVLYESYIRGIWLHRCASDEEVNAFRYGKIKKQFSELIQEIEKIDGFEGGVLSSIKNSSWGSMNSYTHSGNLQAVRRLTEHAIESNYEPKEIEEVINFVNAMSFQVAIGIAILGGTQEVAAVLLSKAEEFYK